MSEGCTDKCALKRRYGGLDLFRVVSAAAVCMFHTTQHLGCDYGPLQGISKSGPAFMTAFFLLSGFSLYLNWAGTSLTDRRAIMRFWRKRALGIMPIYWVVALTAVVLLLVFDRETMSRMLLLAPIEFLGLQSVFHSISGVGHNAGSWFISCLLICYAAYPFLQELIKQFGMREKGILLIACAAILLYSPRVTVCFQIESIFNNPFFRLLEFTVGILLAAIKAELDGKQGLFLFKWWFVALVTGILAAGLTSIVNMGFSIDDFMIYNWLFLPCFALILLGLAGAATRLLDGSRILRRLSGCSYAFYLAQFFSNETCKLLIPRWSVESNIGKICLGWGVCLAITVCIYGVEKMLNRFTKRYA